ncbi:MAG TPA: asparagine synthase-related protein [Gemmataceae bacterium]|nr:asparagine synthase-related protein [Gemmataceae bacterium]
MNCGFLAVTEPGRTVVSTLGDPAAPAASFMSTATGNGATVIFAGRLYYREELATRVGLSAAQMPASHAGLVLAAYRQMGRKALEYLEGDYAVLVWDSTKNTLLACRDLLGGFPLYWIHSGKTIAVSTDLHSLVKLLPKQTINRDYLAEFLMIPGCGVKEMHYEGCAYEGVKRVLPTMLLNVDCQKNTAEISQWWNWREQIEEPASTRLEDVAARYSELLRESVKQRCHGRTAAHLSGGMDSTAVAILAARALRQAGSAEPMHAMSLVYEKLAVLSRETSYIDCALKEPGMVSHRIIADDILDFDGFKEGGFQDEPSLALWNSTMNKFTMDRAVELGIQTLMTGFGADELVNLPPHYLHELIRKGRLIAAWKESSRWAQAYSTSRWRFLTPNGLAHLVPSWLRPGLGHWWRGGYASWDKQTENTIGPWLHKSFAKQYAMRDRAVARIRRSYHSCRPVSLSFSLEMINLSMGDVVRWVLGVPRGLLTTHPYLDQRLVRFGLGIQKTCWPEPGKQKPILAEAMRDVLPEEIRTRKGKGHFNEVYFQGLARNMPVLERVVQTSPVEDMDILDKPTLLNCLHQAALGIGNSAQGVDRLNLSLCLLKWIGMQEAWLKQPPLQLNAVTN